MDRLVNLSSVNISAIGACLDIVVNDPLLFSAVPEARRADVKQTLVLFEQLHAENTIIHGG